MDALTRVGLRMSYFGSRHPLASEARRRCRAEHGYRSGGVGGVACGPCWEGAIRDDERFVTAFGLPREVPALDGSLVDEIAVELACAGERVPLTARERGVAARRLRTVGLSVNQVVTRLGMSAHLVLAATTPYVVEAARTGDDAVVIAEVAA